MNLNCVLLLILAQCISCALLRKGYDETKRKLGTQKRHNYAIFIQSKVWNTLNYFIYFVVVNAEVYKNEGNDEYNKRNFNSAIHFYSEGIRVNCKDEDLNAKLYSNRAAAHFNLGKMLIYIGYYG